MPSFVFRRNEEGELEKVDAGTDMLVIDPEQTFGRWESWADLMTLWELYEDIGTGVPWGAYRHLSAVRIFGDPRFRPIMIRYKEVLGTTYEPDQRAMALVDDHGRVQANEGFVLDVLDATYVTFEIIPIDGSPIGEQVIVNTVNVTDLNDSIARGEIDAEMYVSVLDMRDGFLYDRVVKFDKREGQS